MPGCCWNQGHKGLTERVRIAEIAVTAADERWEASQDALAECQAGNAPVTDQMTLPFVPGPAPRHKPEWVREGFSVLPGYPDLVDWRQMDSFYDPASNDEISQFIFWDQTDKFPYGPLGTCDWDAMFFAAKFKVLTRRNNVFFTVDWNGKHAYVVFLLRDSSLLILEEQTDKTFKLVDHDFRDPYPLQHVMLIG